MFGGLFVQPDELLFPIGDVLRGKFQRPVVAAELLQYWRLRHLPTRHLDFIRDCDDYADHCYAWKEQRRLRREPSASSSRDEGQAGAAAHGSRSDAELFADGGSQDVDIGQQQLQKSASASRSQQQQQRVVERQNKSQKELVKLMEQQQHQRRAGSTPAVMASRSLANSGANNQQHDTLIMDGRDDMDVAPPPVPPLNGATLVMDSGSYDDTPAGSYRASYLQQQQQQPPSRPFPPPPPPGQTSSDGLMRSTGSDLYMTSRRSAARSSGASSKSQPQLQPGSTRALSQLACDIYNKYLADGAPQGLGGDLPAGTLDAVREQYATRSVAPTEKTGQRFVPSADRTFGPVVSAVKRHLVASGQYDDFLQFACGNTVPSSAGCGTSAAVMGTYLQCIIHLLLVAYCVTLALISSVGRWALVVALLPMSALIVTVMLATSHISLLLYITNTKEYLTLLTATAAPTDDVDSKHNTATMLLHVERIAEPLVRRAQNLAVARAVCVAALLSVILLLIAVLVW